MTKWESQSATNIPREACVEPCVLTQGCPWIACGVCMQASCTQVCTHYPYGFVCSYVITQSCMLTPSNVISKKMFTCLCTSASCNWIGNQNHFGLIEECRLWAPASCRCIPVVVWWTRLEDKGGPTHIQETQTSPTCQPHPGWPSKAKHRSLAASS